jgi:hypothetical protein
MPPDDIGSSVENMEVCMPFLRSVVLALALGLSASAAQAGFIWDAVSNGQSGVYSHNSTSRNNWRDSYTPSDAPKFQTFGMELTPNGSDLEVTIYTNYMITGRNVGGQPFPFADPWFNINGNLYAFDIHSEYDPATNGVDSAMEGKVVSNPTFSTSEQYVNINGSFGRWTSLCDGSEADCDANSRKSEVSVTGAKDWTSSDVVPIAFFDPAPMMGPFGIFDAAAAYRFTMANVLPSGPLHIDAFFATAWCANDTLEGHMDVEVPEPAPLGALVVGLAMLGFAARRRKAVPRERTARVTTAP